VIILKPKLLLYPAINVANVFAKETDVLAQLQQGKLNEALILWQPIELTLVLPSGNKWRDSDELNTQLLQQGWQLFSRKTGGAPVPQVPGVINVSHMYVWDESEAYSIPKAYQTFCKKLSRFFALYDVDVDVHATEFSYCDGDYNLNIAGKKVVGTAQRVVLKNGGGKVVLAQACILIDADIEAIIKPVNICYEFHQQTERVRSEVHTCLTQHTDQQDSIEGYFQSLITAFS
jgi:lipoate-protein ligase A